MDKPDENTAKIRCQMKPYIDQLHGTLRSPPSRGESRDSYLSWGINDLVPFLETFLQSFTIDTEFRFTGFGMFGRTKQRKLRGQINHLIDIIRHNASRLSFIPDTARDARGRLIHALNNFHRDITRIKGDLDRECETNEEEKNDNTNS